MATKVATRSKAVSVKQAEAMWDELKGLFVNAEKQIVKIIEARAWEPLGFDSFAEAWQERMQGVWLASEELRAHVVYAMFDEGMSEAEVNATLGFGSGIGPASVKAFQRQRGIGVPPQLATSRDRNSNTTTVREHDRKLPGPPQILHVQFTAAECAQFRAIALAAGREVDSIAQEAIRSEFGKLAAQ